MTGLEVALRFKGKISDQDFQGIVDRLGNRYYPIDEKSNLFLTEFSEGKDARFARQFRKVWSKIPTADREHMVGYWGDLSPISGVPLVHISLEADERMKDHRQNGRCESLGAGLIFFAPIIDLMPARHVRALIAHELGHVFRWSHGFADLWAVTDEEVARHGSRELATKVAYISSDAERNANEIAVRWGFDVKAMHRWCDRWWTCRKYSTA